MKQWTPRMLDRVNHRLKQRRIRQARYKARLKAGTITACVEVT